MRALSIIPVLACFLLAGCGDLPSVEGLATRENTIFDPALTGTWNSDGAVIVSQKGGNDSYRVSWLGTDDTEAPQIVRMEARLVRIGDQKILDLTSSDPGAFAIPCHVFLRVRPVKEGLEVRFVDSKWIRDQVKANSLESFVQDEHPVITASAARVTAFLLRFGLDERALDDPILLRPLQQN